MRIAALILGILGSFTALGVGACSGACMAGLGGAAGKADEGAEAGSSLLLWALLQAVLGIVGGILAFRALGSGQRAKVGGILLLVGAGTSISNTFCFFTAGLLHVIAGAIALAAKPTSKTS